MSPNFAGIKQILKPESREMIPEIPLYIVFMQKCRNFVAWKTTTHSPSGRISRIQSCQDAEEHDDDGYSEVSIAFGANNTLEYWEARGAHGTDGRWRLRPGDDPYKAPPVEVTRSSRPADRLGAVVVAVQEEYGSY